MRPELASLHATWRAIGGDDLPSRPDIGPEALKPWLRNVALVDIERSPLRFRRRLVGTKIVDYQNTDRTGQYLVVGERGTVDGWRYDDYLTCAADAVPVHRVDQSTDLDGHAVRWERLLMPLARDGGTPDMILVGLYLDVMRHRPTLPVRLDPPYARMRPAPQPVAVGA